MIIVRVELWSAISGHKTELARMVIDNIGGTTQKGDYRAVTLRGRSKDALDRALIQHPRGAQREGRVMGHPRLREHVWNLVAKALGGMGYGQNGGAAPDATGGLCGRRVPYAMHHCERTGGHDGACFAENQA